MGFINIMLVISLAFFSCRVDEVRTEEVKYFDLIKYIHDEIATMDSLNPVIKKTVFINSKVETLEFSTSGWDSARWHKEFKAFTEADINKPALRDAYRTTRDTLENGILLTHTATGHKPAVKEIKVLFENSRVKSLNISVNSHNVIYNSSQDITYIPGISYSIKGTQNVSLLRDQDYSLNALFVY